ncbi:MAG: hypothetical protein ACYTGG_11305 [Planctomycetota bacterium]
MTDETSQPGDEIRPRKAADADAPPGAPEDEDHIGLEPIKGDDAPPPGSSSSPPASSSASEVTCPSCGAPMPGADTLVCLRCGYDLKSLKKIETETAVDVQEHLEPPVLTPAGRGGWRLPLIIAGAAAVILVICFLAGIHHVHPRVIEAARQANQPIETVPMGDRWLAVARYLVYTAIWCVGGAAGLVVVAWLNAGRIGDLPLALSRLLAIAAAMRLVALLKLGSGVLEWLTESAGQIGLAFIGLLVFFDLKPRDIGWVLLTAVGVFLVTYGGAQLLVWVA